jgi:hypothetical protein
LFFALKGISFGALASFFGPFMRIVTSVESQDATARSGGEFDPNVFEGGMHTPLAQFRMFLQFAHLIDGIQRHFPRMACLGAWLLSSSPLTPSSIQPLRTV